jgi:hypothetical protein
VDDAEPWTALAGDGPEERLSDGLGLVEVELVAPQGITDDNPERPAAAAGGPEARSGG